MARATVWIGGSTGSGKSTVTRLLAARHGLRVFPVDAFWYSHVRRLSEAAGGAGGELRGDPSGDPSGDRSGDPAGDAGGDRSGDPAGGAGGGRSGEAVGGAGG